MPTMEFRQLQLDSLEANMGKSRTAFGSLDKTYIAVVIVNRQIKGVSCTPTAISKATSISVTTVKRHLTVMVKEGLITRGNGSFLATKNTQTLISQILAKRFESLVEDLV